ncbi:MAG: FixH family protein [Gammaproteobacteria bacterium]|nr:FixH family protein [Gammaproteobacteria bacterium]MBI5783180.1 FixH family protein [Gammaproteobacteria bacterium]
MTSMHGKKDIKQGSCWYREPFVWLLIALPLAAVIGSFVSLGLAISTDDGLVEDDYYRRGKEINRVLARDRAAEQLGLEGTVELDAARHELKLSLDAREDMNLPEQIEFRFLHATRAGLDKDVILPRVSGATYRAPLPELAPGHWNVQLAAQDWRLTGSLFVPGERGLVVRPAAP